MEKSTNASVEKFISQRNIAVVGVSHNPRKFGNMAYRELKAKGYKVFAVNKQMEKLGDEPCYPELQKLPEKVDAALIVVPPQETEKVVQEAHASGIDNIWMQQGAESEAAVRYCQEHGMNEVHGECILMFAGPVKSYHKLHRVIMKCLNKLPN